jgi:heat shock protein HslJ
VPAIASDEPESSQPMAVDLIEGLTWQLQRQAVEGELAALPDDLGVTLLMEGGQAGGTGGCNRYFAGYTRDGDALSFGAIGSTEMYCEGASDVEALYFANLATVASGFSTGGVLLMADAAGDVILEFTPADVAPLPVDGIEGVAWQLSEYLVGGDAVASVPAGVIVTLLLEDGIAGGSGGCNAYSADYTLDGSSLTFGPVSSTLMLCEGPGGEVETAYFAALPLVTGWFADGSGLTLTTADGQALLRFLPTMEAA